MQVFLRRSHVGVRLFCCWCKPVFRLGSLRLCKKPLIYAYLWPLHEYSQSAKIVARDKPLSLCKRFRNEFIARARKDVEYSGQALNIHAMLRR